MPFVNKVLLGLDIGLPDPLVLLTNEELLGYIAVNQGLLQKSGTISCMLQDNILSICQWLRFLSREITLIEHQRL